MNLTIKGCVVRGNELGRRLGFPTANIVADDLPAGDGVYAVRVVADGVAFSGMANLGRRPTIGNAGEHRLLEVNLFGFEGDLYGKTIEVELCAFMRPECKFDSLDQLAEAVGRDREMIDKYFNDNHICI